MSSTPWENAKLLHFLECVYNILCWNNHSRIHDMITGCVFPVYFLCHLIIISGQDVMTRVIDLIYVLINTLINLTLVGT